MEAVIYRPTISTPSILFKGPADNNASAVSPAMQRKKHLTQWTAEVVTAKVAASKAALAYLHTPGVQPPFNLHTPGARSTNNGEESDYLDITSYLHDPNGWEPLLAQHPCPSTPPSHPSVHFDPETTPKPRAIPRAPEARDASEMNKAESTTKLDHLE